MTKLFRLSVLAVALLSTSTAFAHVGALQTKDPYLVGTQVVGAGTTWGITLIEDGVAVRTCDEVNDGVTQFTTHVGGRIFIGTTTGLYVTENGCDPTRVDFAAGTPHLVARSDVDETLAIALDTEEGAQVYRTDNGGDSFELAFSRADFSVLSIALSRDGTRLMVAGFGPSLELGLFSIDDDVTTEITLIHDLADVPTFVNVVGTDDVTSVSRFAISLIGPTGTSRVVLLDVNNALAGGTEATAVELIAAFDTTVTHYAATETGRAVILDRREFRSQIANGAFKLEASGPARCLSAASTTTMVGCGTDESGMAVGTSANGRDWTWSIDFEAIENRLCPAGTLGRFRCGYLFPDLDAGPEPIFDAGVLDGGALDGGPSPDGGAEADGGTAPDDGGGVVDGGQGGGEVDAGNIDDAGSTDGGTVDGGTADGGVIPPENCACSQSHGTRSQSQGRKRGPSLLMWATALVFTGVLRRRRRAR